MGDQQSVEKARCPHASGGSDADAGFCVWLLSDTLLGSPLALDGAGNLSALMDALERGLGEDPGTLFDRAAPHLKAALRSRRIESWQASWGLPRPTLTGLQAGSVAWLPFKPDAPRRPSRAQVEQLERTGIGERRGEGYGQLCFNHPIVSEKVHDVCMLEGGNLRMETKAEASQGDGLARQEASDPPLEKNKNDAVWRFAHMLQKAAWEQAIVRAAHRVAFDEKLRQEALGWRITEHDGTPNMAQLGALRSVMGACEAGDCARVRDWLGALEKNKKRRKKWPEQARKVLADLFSEEDNASSVLWRILCLAAHSDAQPLPSEIAATHKEMRGELRAFALRTLLLLAMRGHKRAMEKNREQRPDFIAPNESSANGEVAS